MPQHLLVVVDEEIQIDIDFTSSVSNLGPLVQSSPQGVKHRVRSTQGLEKRSIYRYFMVKYMSSVIFIEARVVSDEGQGSGNHVTCPCP